MSTRKLFNSLRINFRKLSTDTTGIHFQKASPQPTPVNTTSTSTETIKQGSTFIERLSACLVGIAIGYGVNFYLIYEELKESNKQLELFQQNVESRLKILEGKN